MTDQIVDGAVATAPNIETMPAVATSPSAGADETTHKRPADDNDTASPRKKARNDLSEGEASDGVDEGEVNSDAESKASASTKHAGLTWNSGVTTQLRTSFGSSSKLNAAKPPSKPTPAPAEPSPSSPEELTLETRKELVAAIQAGTSTKLPPVDEHGRSWVIPTFKANFKGQTWDGIFKSMFDQWYVHLLSIGFPVYLDWRAVLTNGTGLQILSRGTKEISLKLGSTRLSSRRCIFEHLRNQYLT